MVRRIVFFLFHIMVCCGISSDAAAQGRLTFVEYNCENLFDIRHDSLKDDREFLPEGARQWNFTRYWRKLNDVSRVLVQCAVAADTLSSSGMAFPATTANDSLPHPGGSVGTVLPDLVAMVEIENDSVMHALTHRALLRNNGMRYVMTQSDDVRGVDVALMYNAYTFRVLEHQSLKVHAPRNQKPTRDILHVKGIHRYADTLHVFVIHAPSRGGGMKFTEPYRMEVAKRLREAVDSVLSASPNHGIIVAGDFNDYHNNKSLKYLTANGMSNVSAHAPSLHGTAGGTYKYQGQWDSLDHILVNDRILSKVSRCFIFDAPWITEDDNAYSGRRPHRTYKGPIYQGGVSDHLPLVLSLDFYLPPSNE